MDNIPDLGWEAGFEGDRRIVVSQFGPFKRIFPCPQRYVRRFHHRVYDLRIEDWRIPLETLRLGPLCTIEPSLTVRFQPTVRYAREHLDQLDQLGHHIRLTYQSLILDATEQELRELEQADWIDAGCGHIERRIEDAVHELLAIRDIQSRARCSLEAVFADPERLDEHTTEASTKHTAIYLEMLRRRAERHERMVREQFDRESQERQLRLEHEERMLEFARQEAELRRQRQEQETQRMRAELSEEELRAAEHFGSEVRLREERIHHESRLRQMELEADLTEKSRRAEAVDDVEQQLRREIELLALERQRLALEEEIHDVRVARAKGWVINAKRRFPLANSEQNSTDAQDAEISGGPAKG